MLCFLFSKLDSGKKIIYVVNSKFSEFFGMIYFTLNMKLGKVFQQNFFIHFLTSFIDYITYLLEFAKNPKKPDPTQPEN